MKRIIPNAIVDQPIAQLQKVAISCKNNSYRSTLREESSQTNVILQYKLLAAILSAVCSVINSHRIYFYLVCNYMMGNMTVKLPHIRPYFSNSVLCY